MLSIRITTDTQMSDVDMIKTYEIRWQTEVFCKAIKSTLIIVLFQLQNLSY